MSIVSVPIIVPLYNHSELSRYKNQKFLQFTKTFLIHYGIFNNSIFVCCDDESVELCESLELPIYRSNQAICNTETIFSIIYELFEQKKMNNFWFLLLSPFQLVKNVEILYKAIQMIDNNYDIICFSTQSFDRTNMIIDDNNYNIKNRLFSILHSSKKSLKIIDDSIFSIKTSFLKECYKKSNGDNDEFLKLLSNGKINIIDGLDEVQIYFTTKHQIDIFFDFIKEIKYAQDIDL